MNNDLYTDKRAVSAFGGPLNKRAVSAFADR